MRGLQNQMLIWIIMISTIVQHNTAHQNKVPGESQQGTNLRPQHMFQPLSSGVACSGGGSVRLFLCPVCHVLWVVSTELQSSSLGFCFCPEFIPKVTCCISHRLWSSPDIPFSTQHVRHWLIQSHSWNIANLTKIRLFLSTKPCDF